MTIKLDHFREPSTWAGLGGLTIAVPGVLGGVGAEKAEIARQGVETVATGLTSGLGLVPSLLLGLTSSLAILFRERGR